MGLAPCACHFLIAHGEVFTDQCKNQAISDMRVKWAEGDKVGKEEWSGKKGLELKVKLLEYHSLWVNTYMFVLH